VIYFEFIRIRKNSQQIQNYSFFLLLIPFFTFNFHYLDYSYFQDYLSCVKYILPIILTIKFLCENVTRLRRLCCFRKVNSIDEADHVFVILDDENSTTKILQLNNIIVDKRVFWFNLFQLKYFYEENRKDFIRPSFFINNNFDYFINYTPLKNHEIEKNLTIFGKNTIEMICPSYFDIAKTKIISPSSIFNFFFVILCIAEGYRSSIFISLFLTFIDVGVSTFNEITYNKSFKSYETEPHSIKVFRNNAWSVIQTSDLVPGDMVSLDRNNLNSSISCDMILVNGTCLVDEAILTGESVPQIKEAITFQKKTETFCLDVHGKSHVLYSGTTLLTVTSFEKKQTKDSKNLCIAIVLRTGFYTEKGRLFRSLLLSLHNDNYNDRETYIYILVLFLFGLGTAIYTWIKRTQTPNANKFLLFIHCIKLVVTAIPIDLSTKLLIFLQRINSQLKKLNIYTMRTSKMPQGGKVDICFFDKTGTLTEDAIALKGVGGLDIETLARFPFESALRRMSCVVTVQNPTFERGYEYYSVVKGAPESLKCMFSKIPHNYDELNNTYSSKGYRVISLGYKKLDFNTGNLNTIKRDQIESDLNFGGFLISQSKIKDDSISTISSIHQMGISTVMISGDNPFTASHVSNEIGLNDKPLLILSPTFPTDQNILCWKGNGFDFRELLSWDRLDYIIQNYQLCITGEALKILISNDSYYQLLNKILPYVRVFARFDPHQKEFTIKLYRSKSFVVFMCGDGANDIGALRSSDIGAAMLNHVPISTNAAPSLKPEKQSNKVINLRKNKNKRQEVKTILPPIDEVNQNMSPGDASIAAHFTFKGPELNRCLHFLKYCMCSLAYFQHIVIISTIYSFTYVYMQATHYASGLVFSD
ncbi:hypothetical protein HZS_7093, partial [Henneguya salminicola]